MNENMITNAQAAQLLRALKSKARARRMLVLVILATFVLMVPASAKFASAGEVVWSTKLDGMSSSDLDAAYAATGHNHDAAYAPINGMWVPDFSKPGTKLSAVRRGATEVIDYTVAKAGFIRVRTQTDQTANIHGAVSVSFKRGVYTTGHLLYLQYGPNSGTATPYAGNSTIRFSPGVIPVMAGDLITLDTDQGTFYRVPSTMTIDDTRTFVEWYEPVWVSFD
jgi:hypothetical protein